MAKFDNIKTDVGDKAAFLEVFAGVFDSNGNVTVCGRDACKRLMTLASAIHADVDYGDMTTGYMNVENIRALHQEIMNEMMSDVDLDMYL